MKAKKIFFKSNWTSNDEQDSACFYNQEFIDDSVDNGMISNEEAGFMLGYLGYFKVGY